MSWNSLVSDLSTEAGRTSFGLRFTDFVKSKDAEKTYPFFSVANCIGAQFVRHELQTRYDLTKEMVSVSFGVTAFTALNLYVGDAVTTHIFPMWVFHERVLVAEPWTFGAVAQRFEACIEAYGFSLDQTEPY